MLRGRAASKRAGGLPDRWHAETVTIFVGSAFSASDNFRRLAICDELARLGSWTLGKPRLLRSVASRRTIAQTLPVHHKTHPNGRRWQRESGSRTGRRIRGSKVRLG